MRFFKKKERADILPLSSNPELDQKNVPGINAYYRDLNEVFNNPRIKNIAITGQRGVGKSSLIKSFDSGQRSFLRRKPKFLYVSLGKYHDDKPEEDYDISSQHASSPKSVSQRTAWKVVVGGQEVQLTLDEPEKTNNSELGRNHLEYETAEEKNAIERRILLQLCSKFANRDFPASGFRLIPKQPGNLAGVPFTIFAMSIFLLLMKQELAELLLRLNSSPLANKLTNVIDWLFKWNDCIEACLYIVIFIGTLIVLGMCYRWIYLRGIGSKLAVKTSNVEWNMEERVPEDYLDRYTQELIYCMSRVGRKIDRTVVFEDMDRLDEEICVQIFTRLREINYLLNTHLDVGKYIRFIFVIDDKVANCLHYDKFFDYVMPVIPTLNRSSSEAVFRANLKKANDELENTIKFDQLVPTLGVVGAKIIVYLDKHPLLKESCCHIRNICIAVKDAIMKCFRGVNSKAKEFTKAYPKLQRMLSTIKRLFGRIYGYVITAMTAGHTIIHSLFTFLKKCPSIRYLFRWLANKEANFCRWVKKQQALLCYREVKQNCASCDKNSASSSVCIRKMEDDAYGIIQMASSVLTDYRMMYTILNEYSLMIRMYHSNNHGRCGCKAAEQILAFQIYKHLWPEDYQNLLSGNVEACAIYAKSAANISEENKELLQKMLDKNLLSIDSLDYAGFSRRKVNELWSLRMKSIPFNQVLANMDPTNQDHQLLVQNHCAIKEGSAVITDVSILRDTIRFALKCSAEDHKDDSWFFDRRDIITCLEAMEALENHEYISFVQRNKKTDDDNIFRKCAYGSNQIQYLQGKCSEQMARIYVMGVPYNDINGIYILLKDESNQRSLVEFMSKEGRDT